MTTPADWHITERRGRDGLRSLESEWRRLYLRMARRTSFIAFEACAEYVDRFLPEPDRVRCLVLDDGREVRAIGLLEPRVERRLGFPVGIWGVLFMNKQCHLADIICPDDEARRVFAPLAAGHLRRHPEGRRFLALGPVERGSALWQGMHQLQAADLCSDQTERMRIMDCRKPFAQVEAGASKNHRHNLKSARRRLAELPDVGYRMVTDPRELAAELPGFLDLEASGWKGEDQSAIRHRPGLADYYAALAAAPASEQDHWEIHSLSAGGRCIASALGSRTGTTFSALKTGYDQAYGRYSPGQILAAHIIERCCADPGIEQINFVSEATWLQGWPSDLLEARQAFVNIGGPAGRILTALLRFRLGRLRRLAAWARSRIRRLGLPAGEEPA
jgi:hypothetical protein